MATQNARPKRTRAANFPSTAHEAGATTSFDPIDELQRLATTALLGEDTFYVSGKLIEDRITELAMDERVKPIKLAEMAAHVRRDLGLRHTSQRLLLALVRRPDGRSFVRDAAREVLRTPRDAMDFMAVYGKGTGSKPAKLGRIAHQLKLALQDGFDRWSGYQIAKYATMTNVGVRLRDVMRLSHPKPKAGREPLFKSLREDTIRAPDTWERRLSATPEVEKRAAWEGLLNEGRLGTLALIRNLRNMAKAKVDRELVVGALAACKASDAWPWQILAAAKHAPEYEAELDQLMLRSAGAMPKISGRTAILVDVSASMDAKMSAKGEMTRIDAACGLAVILREACEESEVWSFSINAVRVADARGSKLARKIALSQSHGGTALGQAYHAVVSMPRELDRVIVLTDEQAQDDIGRVSRLTYVVQLAPYRHGLDVSGKIYRISGFSAGIVRWLAIQENGSLIAASEDDDDEEAEEV